MLNSLFVSTLLCANIAQPLNKQIDALLPEVSGDLGDNASYYDFANDIYWLLNVDFYYSQEFYLVGSNYNQGISYKTRLEIFPTIDFFSYGSQYIDGYHVRNLLYSFTFYNSSGVVYTTYDVETRHNFFDNVRESPSYLLSILPTISFNNYQSDDFACTFHFGNNYSKYLNYGDIYSLNGPTLLNADYKSNFIGELRNSLNTFKASVSGGKFNYQDGYEQGYKSGKNEGYSKGYKAGEEVGKLSGSPIDNGPFAWIKSAFGAVSDFFGINIGGGITLGTLFAIPLVITILIFVIKAIGG